MNTLVYTSYADMFRDMHDLTSINEPFKLVFRKVDGSIKIIPKTIIRKQTPKGKDQNASYKFNYIDVVNDQCGTAYIPLLLSVNDKQIKLI